ncbi:MAG: type VI secretion system lipoprotein TssJ [Pseudomonadales bacterium]
MPICTISTCRVHSLVLLLSAVVLTGCGSGGGAPPVIEVGTDVEVAAALNPDPSGRPSPMVLVIYQLKSADDFRNKDFFSVFDPKGIALGTDLLHREQITLQPGVNQSLESEFDVQTEYVGVLGAFSDIENSRWRAVIELPENKMMDRINVFRDKRLLITVGERSVSISVDG